MFRQPSTTNLFSLPEHVLLDIACELRLQERANLSLVCRDFRALLSTGSAAWHSIEWSARLSAPAAVARTDAFLRWLRPRASQLGSLVLAVVLDNWVVELSPDMLGLLRAVLDAAWRTLTYLKLVLPYELSLDMLLPEMPHLTSLLVSTLALAVPSLETSLPALKQLELFTPEDVAAAFSEQPPCLLPLHLTRLVVVPGPSRIPHCFLRLPELRYLDIGGGDLEAGVLNAALPHLTQLSALALDRSGLTRVPRQLSKLANLQVLSLHQALTGNHVDPGSLTVLSTLSSLSTLSISGCALGEVPPAVAALTTLRVLHTEGALRTLAFPGPYLAGLRVLSLDWAVFFRGPRAMMRQLPRLRRLCLCISSLAGMPMPPPWGDLVGLQGSGEALAAIAQHSRLLSVVVVVAERELAVLTVGLAELLVGLAQSRPGLEVRVVPASAFFLTDGVGAGAGLPPEDEDGEQQQQEEGEPAAINQQS